MTESIGRLSMDKSNDYMMKSNEFKDFESYRSKDGNSPFNSVKQSIDNKYTME